MRKRHSFGQGLMLFELIMAIGLFTVFSALCLQLFFAARTQADESATLNRAITEAESAAERWKAGRGTKDLFYDRSWADTSAQEAVYTLRMEPAASDGVSTAFITVERAGGEELFSLTVKRPVEVVP